MPERLGLAPASRCGGCDKLIRDADLVEGLCCDCKQHGDLLDLRAENERLRAALRHIAGQGCGRWGGTHHVDNFGEPWMHWAGRAEAALASGDTRKASQD
ncbi:MAG TPA: hypothetical protein VFT50_11510 [Baekduia sp.]|nr:hypothetical protein [Baekduia sp.]